MYNVRNLSKSGWVQEGKPFLQTSMLKIKAVVPVTMKTDRQLIQGGLLYSRSPSFKPRVMSSHNYLSFHSETRRLTLLTWFSQ